MEEDLPEDIFLKVGILSAVPDSQYDHRHELVEKTGHPECEVVVRALDEHHLLESIEEGGCEEVEHVEVEAVEGCLADELVEVEGHYAVLMVLNILV